jgi:hypothetical protein
MTVKTRSFASFTSYLKDCISIPYPIVPPPDCSFNGDGPYCPGSVNTHTGMPGMDTYLWTISGNGSIIGSNSNQSVNVLAGANCGQTYSLTLLVTKNNCPNPCTQSFLVADTTIPMLTGQGNNVTIQCPMTPVFTPPNATDNCDSNPVVTFTDNVVSGTCAGTGVHTRTLTATDACGNVSSSVSQTITIIDNIAPALVCGSNKSVPCGASVIFNPPTVSDDCDQNPVIQMVGAVITNNPNGTVDHTRTWFASDDCGNVSQNCSQTITVWVCGGSAHCTKTQGYWGNKGGKHCNGMKTTPLLSSLLIPNLVIGDATNTVTFFSTDSSCIIMRLPGGSSPSVITAPSTCANPAGYNVRANNGRILNYLLSQTITLGLNLRLDPSLEGLALQGQYLTTLASTACGALNSVAIPATYQTFWIPPVVLNYLGTNNNVGDLYTLANQALGQKYVQGQGQPSLSRINRAVSVINEAFDNFRVIGGLSNTPPNTRVEESSLIDTESDEPFIQTYPNPFTSKTIIDFDLPGNTQAKLEVFDLNGIQVATLFDGTTTMK